jgi:hypothetical protein
MSDDERLKRIKRLSYDVIRTKGGYTAHHAFHNAMTPELVMALVECAESLKELYQKKVTTITPDDRDFLRSSVALSRLEAECQPLI